jgi:hypothetical protein
MQIRRETIVGIIIPVCFAIILVLLGYQVKTMPDWVFYIGYTVCGLTIIGASLSLTPIWDTLFKKKTLTIAPTPNLPANEYKNILGIMQDEPSNHPPIIFNIISTILSSVILAFGLMGVYVWIIGRMQGQPFSSLIIWSIIFVAFPIYNILDTYIGERKYYRLGKSAVAKHKTIILRGHIDEIFNTCLKVINARIEKKRNSRIWKMDRPNLIKALIGGLVITVETKHVENNKVAVYIQSDSPWVTTKIDFGNNQRNIDRFEHFIQSELSTTEYDNDKSKFQKSEGTINASEIIIKPRAGKAYLNQTYDHLMWASIGVGNTNPIFTLFDVEIRIINAMKVLPAKKDMLGTISLLDLSPWNPIHILWPERKLKANISPQSEWQALVAFSDDSNGPPAILNTSASTIQSLLGGHKIGIEISSTNCTVWKGEFYIECRPNISGIEPSFEFKEWDKWLKEKDISHTNIFFWSDDNART